MHTVGKVALISEHSSRVHRFGLADRLEFGAVCHLEMRSHIVGAVPQVHFEILVAKDFLFIAKDGVCEAWMECRNQREARRCGRYQADVRRIVGVGQPSKES